MKKKIIKGDPALWSDLFPVGLLPEVLELVVTTWQGFEKPTVSELETQINRRFAQDLRKNQILRRLPFNVEREVPVDDTLFARELGRIDLKFTAGYRHDVYFGLECKKLNVAFQSGKKTLAREYVVQGMLRYIQGKYAQRLIHGGMVGYVMDGQCDEAAKCVKAVIRRFKRKLKVTPRVILVKSSIRITDDRVLESKHDLGKLTFTIHHMFLAA